MADQATVVLGIFPPALERDGSLDDLSMNATERMDKLIIEEQKDMNRSIRNHMKLANQTKWGLPIVRCTYTSQARWDKYVSLIHEHLQEFLEYDEDNFLNDSLCCPIIEDKNLLDGATWKEARTTYDEWVREDMKANPLGPAWFSRGAQTPEEKLKHDISRSPYWMFFIYADEASVASVLDTESDPSFRLVTQGDYWMTIVVSALFGSRSCAQDENGNVVEDYEGEIEEECPSLCIKVKIMELIRVYTLVAWDGYYAFDKMFAGEDGIWHP